MRLTMGRVSVADPSEVTFDFFVAEEAILVDWWNRNGGTVGKTRRTLHVIVVHDTFD